MRNEQLKQTWNFDPQRLSDEPTMGQNGGPYTEEELGYMEQEEEWEREGLLDPAWEKQQKKVSLPEKFIFLFCRDWII